MSYCSPKSRLNTLLSFSISFDYTTTLIVFQNNSDTALSGNKFCHILIMTQEIILEMQNSFYNERICPENPKWEQANKREITIYGRNNEIRSDFERDYTRILHSQAYRRLKHKTQVFFAPHNDHICTRMEHVMHVASVATTIAKYLGLNEQLAGAIAMGPSGWKPERPSRKRRA